MNNIKIFKNDYLKNEITINKLFIEYFYYKLNNTNNTKQLNNCELKMIIRIIYTIFFNNDLSNDEPTRTFGLQLYYMLVELNYLTIKQFSNLKLIIGDYPWINLNKEKINLSDEEDYYFENKLNDYYIDKYFYYERQKDLINCFKDDKNYLISAPTSFGKQK